MASDDAIGLLKSDHRTVEELFEQYERTQPSEHERRRRIVDEIVRELMAHASVEQQHLYPFIDEHVEGGDVLADEGLEGHQEVEELLEELDTMEPDDERFDGLVRRVIVDVRHHVEEEEREFLPRLVEAADTDALAELGRRLRGAKNHAPTPSGTSPGVGDRALFNRARNAVGDPGER